MSTLNGLPAHILLVHAIVVLVPLAALLLVLSIARPSLRERLAGPNAVLSLVVLALVPVTTSAGEWLQSRVGSTETVRKHAEQGDTALYVAIPLAAMALVVWWRGREADALIERPGGGGGGVATLTRTYLAPTTRVVTTVVAVLAVLAAVAAVYDVYLIGDSGAAATWQDSFSSTPLPDAPQGG
jgi:hypothetical protein